jgi:8-oxo-dGTP pyrophosphatase MutT (NUDIX family)
MMDADIDFPIIYPTIESLRQHFKHATQTVNPLFNPDRLTRAAAYTTTLKPSAVLIPILANDEKNLRILLTKRSAHLANHAGQISFPGGRQEEGDDTIIATALRESFEEIALSHSDIDILGTLAHYITSTGYHVTPVVGLIRSAFTPVPSLDEVIDTLEIPLDFAMNPENYSLEQHTNADVTRTFYQLNYPGHHIWGATAAMLFGLYETLLQSHIDP